MGHHSISKGKDEPENPRGGGHGKQPSPQQNPEPQPTLLGQGLSSPQQTTSTTSNETTLDQSSPPGPPTTSDGSESSKQPQESAVSSSSVATDKPSTPALNSNPGSASSTLSTSTEAFTIAFPNTSGHSKSAGPMIGAVLGIIVGLLLFLIPVALMLKCRRRNRSFAELEDPAVEPDARWSAGYATAVGYDLSHTNSSFNIAPGMLQVQYGTPITSFSEFSAFTSTDNELVHITPQATVSSIRHEDKRQSPTYGHSPLSY